MWDSKRDRAQNLNHETRPSHAFRCRLVGFQRYVAVERESIVDDDDEHVSHAGQNMKEKVKGYCEMLLAPSLGHPSRL